MELTKRDAANHKMALMVQIASGLAILAIIYLLSKFKHNKDVVEQKHEETKQLIAKTENKIKMEDKGYLDKLDPIAKANGRMLVSEMKLHGITNPMAQAAILAIVSKESGFKPKNENLNYTAAQLQKVFKLDAVTAKKIEGKPMDIAGIVYSPPHNKQLGNLNASDAQKFIGRGFNQITGRANYATIGKKIGVDLINHPELLNDPKVASDAVIQFFKDGIAGLIKNGRLSSMYNATGINDFKTENDALGAMYNINAGVNASLAHINADVTGGRALAMSRINSLSSLTV